MPELNSAPPVSAVDPVTEVLHGVAVNDPYRWLEDQSSPRTREWIAKQTSYARTYLDNIRGRDRIQKRIQQFLAVETQDSVQKRGGRYFFRKRLPDQEQACIYMREAPKGPDELLVDPSALGQGTHTSVKPLRVSADGKLLLYEIKNGGERMGTFAIVDTESRRTLSDTITKGYLRGFAFAPDGKSFVYVHDALNSGKPFYRAARRHILGTDSCDDQEIFYAGEGSRLRLGLITDSNRIGFIVCRLGEQKRVSVYLKTFQNEGPAQRVLTDAAYLFAPFFANDRLFALTDRDAPNLRIVELRLRANQDPQWIDVVPETDARIHQSLACAGCILVSYVLGAQTRILLFDLEGNQICQVAASRFRTIRLVVSPPTADEVFLETESFTEPPAITRYCPVTGEWSRWFGKNVCFDSSSFAHTRVWFRSKDGTGIPMFLAGRRDLLAEGCYPTIMTSYGGYGVPTTPQFSVFVAFLMEHGCLFALPQIRGGSDFGSAWHEAARRRKRQTAYDDFLSAAAWLIETGRTTAGKLAIFGGSNSGLLVAAAITQRPDLFRAAVCMVPVLDMLRYHLFDGAHIWEEEFGTAEDPEDFKALAAYSPYHQVRDGVQYPAVLVISGDADGNCNPLHARKMVARLQAANGSDCPILLDYSTFRGHSPMLPLSQRIEALTDRMAFLADQLGLDWKGQKPQCDSLKCEPTQN